MPLCAFCGSSNHYLCPFKNNEDLFVVPDEYDENIKDFTFENQNQKNKNKNINKKINRNNSESLLNFFSNEIKMTEKIKLYLGELPKDIAKEEIKNTVFCCKCGGDHFSELCGKIKNKKKIQDDDFDLNDWILKLRDNFDHIKNPLKFEPYAKKEYRINHHNFNNDYYDQEDSSGESFNKVFKK